jgi:uncharacterized membrane-anchored protein YhcB (DUF1043 family)
MVTGWSWTHVAEIAVGIVVGALIIGLVARR